MSTIRFEEEFPLHWCVWQDDYTQLQKKINENVHDLEKFDVRGRTPLLLSVTLGHLDSTRVLLRANANVNVENKEGFSVLHEAVSTGDPELVEQILERRDYQRYSSRVGGIPELLKRIRDTPDFYVEMKWEFTSWVPLVSRMCPSDTYKVYKSGSNVRIDTTLLGFDQSNWQRGSRSYVFKGQEDSATMMEIDHESGQVYFEKMRVLSSQVDDIRAFRPTSEAVSSRLTTPIVTTFVDTDKINFERNKSGIWGWRSDRTEIVNGHESKVFGANNVELVTKSRTEHLTEADKVRHKSTRSPLQSLLGIVEVEEKAGPLATNGDVKDWIGNPCHITPEEYFDPEVDLSGRDIGRPREILTKVQKFKANLWLCEHYPLSLPEQILPIVDLMAISSTHFAKLRDFITLQLPSGFPVKIEIPLFHVLNARITFGNIFALDEAVTGVTPIKEGEVAVACALDDSCFDTPSGYVRLGDDSLRPLSIDEDGELLQYAIRQSLMEVGTEEDQVTIWEALKARKPTANDGTEDEDFQKAIQESLTPAPLRLPPTPTENLCTNEESQLELALKLSKQAREDEEKQLQEEQEVLARVLQLSLAEQ